MKSILTDVLNYILLVAAFAFVCVSWWFDYDTVRSTLGPMGNVILLGRYGLPVLLLGVLIVRAPGSSSEEQ